MLTPAPVPVPPQRGDCQCQMLGFGVYFAERRKALEFAIKKAQLMPFTGTVCGALLVCRVDLGHMKTAKRVPCPHGCGKDYVDHIGAWYAWEGYDSLYVHDNSPPATYEREWCVADPARIEIVEVAFPEALKK